MQSQENKVPQHLAIIMDGNGRWAKNRGKQRSYGHIKGVEAVRVTLSDCKALGINCVTLYTFSSENWSRPEQEVKQLMELLVSTIKREMDEFMKEGFCVDFIGDETILSANVRQVMQEVREMTRSNGAFKLTIALNYGSKQELVGVTKQICEKVKSGEIDIEQIDDELISGHLQTAGLPDVDLMIRTGGEYRLSNFLLWQMAYSEFYFTSVLWPDFDKEELNKAVNEFQSRDRRFGAVKMT